MNFPDPSISLTASSNSGEGVIVFAGNNNSGQRIQFVNPPGSGAFDFSLDGGNSWHTRSMSGAANGYSETQQLDGKVLASNIQIRKNAAATAAVIGLTVDLFF